MSRSIPAFAARVTAGVAGVLAIAALAAGAATAATITVDTADDDGTVTGDCELREAINSVIGNPGIDGCTAGEAAPIRDTIEFDIGANGSEQTITPASQLPTFDQPVEIDGTNNGAAAQLPRIGIDATAATNAVLILSAGADESHIHHLAVYDGPSDGLRILSDDNLFERLFVGLDLADAAAGNGDAGISVRGAGNEITESVISGNDGNGIVLEEDLSLSETTDTTIAGNRIGTNPAGTEARANGLEGIRLFGEGDASAGTVIGGPADPTPGGVCDGDCNLISGNADRGIEASIAGSSLDGLEIRGNYVGTDATGTGALANTGSGVVLSGALDQTLIRDNLISANGGGGVELFAAAAGPLADTVIRGNRIGVDREGDDPLGNSGRGIRLDASLNGFGPITGTVIGGPEGLTPGGACAGACNVIGGNGLDGISLFRIEAADPMSGTQILGNHIGADAAGTGSVANTQHGVTISGAVTETSIGSPAAPNVISGNTLSGVLILDDTGSANAIRSNLIGTTSNGTQGLGNGENGVEVFSNSSGASVGGLASGEGNTIAFNADAGVFVGGGGDRIPILGNAIRANGGLGIDLLPDLLTTGVTPNDGPGDPDTAGGNRFQNFPVLSTVAPIGSETIVRGVLESTPSTRYRVELFGSAVADGSGFGEGAAFLGAVEVVTDAAGRASIDQRATFTVAAGTQVAATATELDGAGAPVRTSEFSQAVAAACDITATDAGETIAGGPGDEVICALGGDDVVHGGGGDDVIVGGGGVDRAAYVGSPVAVEVDLVTGTASGEGADVLLEMESAEGSAFGDRLVALPGGSALIGGGGADELIGGGGPDSLDGGSGADDLSGGDAGDTLSGGSDGDDLDGGGGSDELVSKGGRDDLSGGGGADTVKAGGGDKDEVRGGGGDDSVKGGGGKKDDVRGGGGRDKLDGGGGKQDSCDGGGGKDRKSAPGCESEKSLP